MKEQSLLNKIIYFPVTRILIGFFMLLFFYGSTQFLFGGLFEMFINNEHIQKLLVGIFASLAAILVYIGLYKHYEERDINELSFKRIGFHLSLGIFLGFLLQSLTIFVMYLKGHYEIIEVNALVSILPALAMAFSSAIFEEILLRGIVFRITEESLGSYLALLISALFFGLMHLGNPNSTLQASIGIALQAGLLLGVAYMFTRNLWFPIAIHFAWNFSQAGIYGASVSGHKMEATLMVSKIEGPEWITGGHFGPEGSIQATVFCLIVMLILFYFCKKQNKLILPYWKDDEI